MARWDGIEEFVQVVDCGSFTAAAERLGQSTSQVSKLLARLEQRLGVTLLNRTTRRLTLTDAGEHFYQHCKQTIDGFEAGERALASLQSAPRGHLKINIAGSFQERFLVPILADFSRLYPELEISVQFSDRRIDLIDAGFDVTICPGELEDSSMVARKLADNFLYLVAHPGYLAAHGTPQSVDELKQHNLLAGSENLWTLGNGQQTVQLRAQGNWHSDNGTAQLAAARCSVGIALLPFFTVLDDIAQGDLIHVLPEWSKHPQPVWIMYPHGRYLSAKVRVFIDYLVEHLSEIRL